MMVMSAYFRHRARKKGGVIARRKEGALALFLRVITTLPLLASIILYAVNPRWMDWSALHVPAQLRWLGVVLGIASLPLIWWVLNSIGSNISETVLTKQDHKLVEKGPYRWVRHPLYSVGLVEIFSLSLIAANWFMGLLCLIGLIVFRMVVIPREEAHLIAVFNQEYERYRARTGALIPRL